ncbi:MAG: hypothetical protein HZA54_02335, partial [Planctomycetes bacterium]|nr:hypothetical protein [Planctomycetota bacterium]
MLMLFGNVRAGTMSTVLQIAGVILALTAFVVPLTFLTLAHADDIDTKVEVLLCVYFAATLTGALLLVGTSVAMLEIERMRSQVESAPGSFALGEGLGAGGGGVRPVSPREKEELERLEAKQALDAVKTYIDLEMWALALQKGEDLIQKYPKSAEAEKLRKNIDHIRKKAEESMPKPPKPVAAPAPAPAAPAPAVAPAATPAKPAAPKVIAAPPKPVPAAKPAAAAP